MTCIDLHVILYCWNKHKIIISCKSYPTCFFYLSHHAQAARTQWQYHTTLMENDRRSCYFRGISHLWIKHVHSTGKTHDYIPGECVWFTLYLVFFFKDDMATKKQNKAQQRPCMFASYFWYKQSSLDATDKSGQRLETVQYKLLLKGSKASHYKWN